MPFVNKFGGAAPSRGAAALVPGPGKLYVMGKNAVGQLGLGDTTDRSSPVQVGALTTWMGSSRGKYRMSAFTKNDNTIWMCGNNDHGALGQGNTTNRSSPVQVGDADWANVGCFGAFIHMNAIKTNGTMWGWGYNLQGNLGVGDTTYRSSPTQVGALTTWSMVYSGFKNTIAIKTDGTMWCWGIGSYGGNGDGTTTNRSSPVQVGALTTWAKAIHSLYYTGMAIKTDGTLWMWGNNTHGQLGLGDTTHRSSPVQVGSSTNWTHMGTAGRYANFVIDTDGKLFAWGRNNYGQLGLGDTTSRSSPVQVGVLTTWGPPGNTSPAHNVKTDGTLWGWGLNSNGAIGLGDTTNRSSPVQVGGLTTWGDIDAHGTTYGGSSGGIIKV